MQPFLVPSACNTTYSRLDLFLNCAFFPPTGMCSHNTVIITYNSQRCSILLSHLGFFFLLLKSNLSLLLTLASYCESAIYNIYVFTCLRLQTPLKRTAQCVSCDGRSGGAPFTTYRSNSSCFYFVSRAQRQILEPSDPLRLARCTVPAGLGFVHGLMFSEKHNQYGKGFVYHD